MRNLILLFPIFLVVLSCKEETKRSAVDGKQNRIATAYTETYRPQYHFSPLSGWMNDPNGLVYHEGVYHLFFQHYPNAIVWGPMHWGHATSKDLVHWTEKPIALFPDEKGFIFSGSAVVDVDNTSGFAKEDQTPLVAIYTYFRLDVEKTGGANTQSQGIAYSLDNGETWTKHDGNPILEDLSLTDFRDPKVFWHEKTKSWIMVLVAGDHAKFYRSKNLKEWIHVSDFGKEQGAHGGVWECPDLFKLKVEGSEEEKWVLLISIGSGGPNGGSGTQYFIGDFDGDNFVSKQTEYKWLDWGTDNYAGVTYNNAPNEDRIFIGWMSNWQYALKTPTDPWRSAMTLPRKLTLRKINGTYHLVNYPVNAVSDLEEENAPTNITVAAKKVVEIENKNSNQAVVRFTTTLHDFKLSFGNSANEESSLLFDEASKLVMLDRTKSGKTNFNYDFGNKLHYMPVNDLAEEFEVTIYMDKSSMEVFVDEGRYVMTTQLFPTENYTTLKIENLSTETLEIKNFSINDIDSIWKK